MLTKDEAIRRLQACADDPMWADEVHKATLLAAVVHLSARPLPQAELSDAEIEKAAMASGLGEEMWFGRFTPDGYTDALPKLRAFARAVLFAARPVAVGWQPMATAPKDGTHVYLYAPKFQFVGFYSGSEWVYVAPHCPAALTQPTHWMPLHAAPSCEFESQEARDAARLDFLQSWSTGDVIILAPGQHGGSTDKWLLSLERGDKADRFGVPCDEYEGADVRAAIDAAMSAAPEAKP